MYFLYESSFRMLWGYSVTTFALKEEMVCEQRGGGFISMPTFAYNFFKLST